MVVHMTRLLTDSSLQFVSDDFPHFSHVQLILMAGYDFTTYAAGFKLMYLNVSRANVGKAHTGSSEDAK